MSKHLVLAFTLEMNYVSQQLTQDVSTAIAHTCFGYIGLIETQLSNGPKYVFLGWFSEQIHLKSFFKASTEIRRYLFCKC